MSRTHTFPAVRATATPWSMALCHRSVILEKQLLLKMCVKSWGHVTWDAPGTFSNKRHVILTSTALIRTNFKQNVHRVVGVTRVSQQPSGCWTTAQHSTADTVPSTSSQHRNIVRNSDKSAVHLNQPSVFCVKRCLIIEAPSYHFGIILNTVILTPHSWIHNRKIHPKGRSKIIFWSIWVKSRARRTDR